MQLKQKCPSLPRYVCLLWVLFSPPGQGPAGAAAAAAGSSSSSAGSSGPGCSDGSLRAGKGPVAQLPACARCMPEMSMEWGSGGSWWGVWHCSSPLEGDLVFLCCFSFAWSQRQDFISTSLCMLSVPSRFECCLYWHRNAHESDGLLWAHYKSDCWYLECSTSSFIRLS